MSKALLPLWEGTLDARGADGLCLATFLVVVSGYLTGFITQGRWHAAVVNVYHILGIVVRVYPLAHREIAEQMGLGDYVVDVLFIIAIVFSVWFLIRGKRKVESKHRERDGGSEIT